KGTVTGTQVISFKPPKYGWYAIHCEAGGSGVAHFIGVTPKFPNIHALAPGEATGWWNDHARESFAGLMLDRCNTNPGAEAILKNVERAEKYGVTLLVQFENKGQCTPERVKEIVTKLKGRVKYWEIMNEPNFAMNP